MTIPIAILTLLLAGVVVFVVGAPLRAARRAQTIDAEGSGTEEQEPVGQRAGAGRADLEAEREAKYQEIRDAELDFRTGKLSPEDYAAIDADLRAEALEILDHVEELERGEEPESQV